jgi:hypothetical protein
VVERFVREPRRRPDPLDQRRLEPALLGGLGQGAGAPRGREQLLQVAVRQPAGLGGLPQLGERVPALAQARDDPGLGDGGGRPLTVGQRHDAVAHPPAQHVGGNVEPPGNLAVRHIRHEPG